MKPPSREASYVVELYQKSKEQGQEIQRLKAALEQAPDTNLLYDSDGSDYYNEWYCGPRKQALEQE